MELPPLGKSSDMTDLTMYRTRKKNDEMSVAMATPIPAHSLGVITP
jgi:hypothetical protein